MKFRFAWLFLLLAAGARAQSTEADLRATLVGAPLYLKGCYREDKLRFDSTGTPRDKVHTVPFTLSGVDVDGVQLSGNKLILKGRRMGLHFLQDQPGRVPLRLGRYNDLRDEGVEIEIDVPSGVDSSTVLAQVFAFNLKQMVPAMSDEWQVWARLHLLSEPASDQSMQSHDLLRRKVGGAVSAPRVLYAPEPEYSEYARRIKWSGSVLVYLVVDTDGRPQDVRVARPLGLGLDEQAIKAVRGYKFAPSVENERPVKVEMNILVNFKIY